MALGPGEKLLNPHQEASSHCISRQVCILFVHPRSNSCSQYVAGRDIADRTKFDFSRLTALRALTISHHERAQALSLQASLRAAPPPSLRELELTMEAGSDSDIPLLERLQLWDDAITNSSWNSLEKVVLAGLHDEAEEMLRRWSPHLNEKGILVVK